MQLKVLVAFQSFLLNRYHCIINCFVCDLPPFLFSFIVWNFLNGFDNALIALCATAPLGHGLKFSIFSVSVEF